MKKKFPKNNQDCVLLLEDGSFFWGFGYGTKGNFIGEICFNTAVTGYQEILTDPSYYNQIINFTFPHIGIVGTNRFDYESSKIFASACIINNPLTKASNFRSEIDFEKWLKINGKACITGVDTRVLTKKIRNNGACKALIHFPRKKTESLDLLLEHLRKFPKMNNQDLASEVSTKEPYQWTNSTKKKVNIKKINNNFVAVIDFGIKKNILCILEKIDFPIIVFPLNHSLKKIVSLKPSGIFLSNGPGDPLATFKKIRNELSILKTENIPIFGICLGHQILSLLYGASTEKMHHGHRGANHPIKNLSTQKVEITVQNHGFVVSKKNIPSKMTVTHTSLFDKTIAGIKIKEKPFFSVQYHPESSPGPQDSRYLFDQFSTNIRKYAKKK